MIYIFFKSGRCEKSKWTPLRNTVMAIFELEYKLCSVFTFVQYLMLSTAYLSKGHFMPSNSTVFENIMDKKYLFLRQTAQEILEWEY